MSVAARSRDLVLAADPHVGRDDPDLPGFLAWLAARREDAGTVVLLGDLFSLWLGLSRWTEPHHRAVLDACADLRAAGVRVVLVEGNRELWAEPWAGRAFDVVAREWHHEAPDGTRWVFLHGDLLNRADRRNLLFQAIVRSGATRAFFRALPAGAALAFGRRLERALRGRYRRERMAPSPGQLAAWAGELARRGADAVALGHFHVELARPAAGSGEARVYLVPDWRARRRHLRIPAEGEPRFEVGGPPLPARVRVAGAEAVPDGALLLILAEPAPLPAPGAPVAVDAGEGPEVRRGRLVEVRDEAGGPALLVRLEPGPPVRPGDRLILPGEEAPDVP